MAKAAKRKTSVPGSDACERALERSEARAIAVAHQTRAVDQHLDMERRAKQASVPAINQA